jgi:hypothetical protein
MTNSDTLDFTSDSQQDALTVQIRIALYTRRLVDAGVIPESAADLWQMLLPDYPAIY